MFKKSNVGSSDNITIIAKGCNIKGEIFLNNNSIRVDGKIEGSLVCKNKIIIGESGHVKGLIEANNIEINGFAEGNLKVKNELVLKSSSNVSADIITRLLKIEENATLNGAIKMGELAFENISIKPLLNKKVI